MPSSLPLRATLLLATIAWSVPTPLLPSGFRVGVLDPWPETPGDPQAMEIGDSLRAYLRGEDLKILPSPRQSVQDSTIPATESCGDSLCAARWGQAVRADRVVFGRLSNRDGVHSLRIGVLSPFFVERRVRTITDTSSDTAWVPRLAKSSGAHLAGRDPGPRRALVPGRTSIQGDDTDAMLRTLCSQRDLALTVGISAGVLTAVGGMLALGASLAHPSTGYKLAIALFAAPALFTIVEANEYSTTNSRIEAIQRRRRADLQILPYVDPVHGSAGVFARAGF